MKKSTCPPYYTVQSSVQNSGQPVHFHTDCSYRKRYTHKNDKCVDAKIKKFHWNGKKNAMCIVACQYIDMYIHYFYCV